MKELKEIIKKLSAEQRQLRKERKVYYATSDREVRQFKSPWSSISDHGYAAIKHRQNRGELRHLFTAYTILKGKEPIKPKRAYINEKKVQSLVEKYSLKENIVSL